MAERLHRICGTEEDKVNCPFFFKIGACRHGETCTRFHIRPTASQTLIFPHMYENPTLAIALASGDDHMIPKEKVEEVQNHFEEFYEDVFLELANYGEIEELYILNNINAHMLGNVYVKFTNEEDAENCLRKVSGRYYAGKPIYTEFSPVTDFREARCRQFDEGSCNRGGHCNFMHLKPVGRKMREYLYDTMYKEHPEYQDRHKKKSDRSHKKHHKHGKKDSRRRSRSRSRSRSHSGSGDKKDKHKQMSSEERRAMIAMWQMEDEKKDKEAKEPQEGQNTSAQEPFNEAAKPADEAPRDEKGAEPQADAPKEAEKPAEPADPSAL